MEKTGNTGWIVRWKWKGLPDWTIQKVFNDKAEADAYFDYVDWDGPSAIVKDIVKIIILENTE